MSSLKGGSVVGIRFKEDDQVKEVRNDDGTPLTFILEDQTGEQHELYLIFGRMGSYPMFAHPPYRVGLEHLYDEAIPAAPTGPARIAQTEDPDNGGRTKSRVRVGAGRGRAVGP